MSDELTREFSFDVQVGPNGRLNVDLNEQDYIAQAEIRPSDDGDDKQLSTGQEILRKIIDIVVIPMYLTGPLGPVLLLLRARGLQPVGLGVGLFVGADVGIPLPKLPAGPGVGGDLSVAALVSLDNPDSPRVVPFVTDQLSVSTPKASAAAGLIVALLFAPRNERLDPVEAFKGKSFFASVGAGPILIGADIGGGMNLSLLNGRAGAIFITLGLSFGPEAPVDITGGIADTEELARYFTGAFPKLPPVIDEFFDAHARWHDMVLRARQNHENWNLSSVLGEEARNALSNLAPLLYIACSPADLDAFSRAMDKPIGELIQIPGENTFIFLETEFRAMAEREELTLRDEDAPVWNHLYFIGNAKPWQFTDALRVAGLMSFNTDICAKALELARKHGEEIPGDFVRAGLACDGERMGYDEEYENTAHRP